MAGENKSEDITEASGRCNEGETSKRELNYSTSEEEMEPIKINVNKQMDGYVFSLSVSNRKLIRSLLPQARPANLIFVGYDIQSDFARHATRLEKQIFPALLGVRNEKDLKKLREILFVNPLTGTVLHRLNPS